MKKIYILLFLSSLFFDIHFAQASGEKRQYSRQNTSNYFSGTILSKNHYYKEAFKRFKKVKLLKDEHFQFNVEFIRTLVLLEKFEEALKFSKEIWNEDELFFEADLLIGLDYFIKEDYINAEKYFKRLNKISINNPFFYDFIGNILLSWNKASQKDKVSSFRYIDKIPKPFQRLKKSQSIFLNCYFDEKDTVVRFENLIEDKDYNFFRYNYFLINYLLHKNQFNDVKKVIQNIKKEYETNLLIKQAQEDYFNNDFAKIKNFFSCKKPKDAIAELFYIISNLYSSENDYELSNFYLQISLFLNNRFLSNKALLAENYFYQKKYTHSKEIYEDLKKIGSVYSWHGSKSIAQILLITKDEPASIKTLVKAFNSLPEKKFEHYYELANFYKEQNNYKESIKYYSLALKNASKYQTMIPKVLDRRGTSFERLGDWKNAEKDLKESLKILPDQPYVLNYLAYTWIDKGLNLKEGLEMLEKAAQLKENDGYIIDSLGWAHYLNKNYSKAELLLKEAVKLMPFDPIINDHYADALWMVDKNIQARYFWKHVLSLDETTKDLKEIISNKIIFGIDKKKL